ncbi:MAG: hypothetical protein ACK5ML_11960 [Lachnospiraceae bacterium]
MQKINLNKDVFDAKLLAIEKGFKTMDAVVYDKVESNLLTMDAMILVLNEMNAAIEKYHVFLKNDVEKFLKVGDNIKQSDTALSQKLTGGL